MNRLVRILVVDDEPDTLGLIELTLQTAGFHVQAVASGEDALGLLRREGFDLVLLDIMMPNITGFDIIRKLRSEGAQIPPVIFLTAKTGAEDRQTGELLGAAAYLTKPTTRGQLLDVVRRSLGESPSPNAAR
jgi:two-component system OmpR family response regulator